MRDIYNILAGLAGKQEPASMSISARLHCGLEVKARFFSLSQFSMLSCLFLDTRQKHTPDITNPRYLPTLCVSPKHEPAVHQEFATVLWSLHERNNPRNTHSLFLYLDAWLTAAR